MELPGIDCVLCDVLTLSNNEKWENAFDTIVTNPPFGTKKNCGIDMLFVQTGVFLASGAVYSFHKSSTRYKYIFVFMAARSFKFYLT